MQTITSLLDRWRAWRPLGIAKRVLSVALTLVIASSLLALGPGDATPEPPARPTAASTSDHAVVAASASLPGAGPAIEAAPEPAPAPLGSELLPPAAEAPTTIAAAAAEQAERRAEEAAAEAAAAEQRQLWYRLADCESGVRRGGTPVAGSARWDYGLTPGETAPFEGGLQFAPSTWDQFRDAGMPDHAGYASPAQQIAVAERVLAAQGWGAWPVCSRMLGLRG